MKYTISEVVYYLSHRLPAMIKGKYLYHNLVRVHWGRGMNNFGDCLSPDILKYYGLTPVFVSNDADADILLAGTILQWVDESFSGFIVGTGGLVRHSFKNATICAVRGPLTYKHLLSYRDVDAVSYGDPGLLMSFVYPEKVERKYDLGIIPHFVDWNTDCVNNWRNMFKDYKNVIFISPIGKPKDVIKKIKSCHHIVSSSLHGLIIADAFHIPNMRFVNRQTMSVGHDYKYDDYYSSLEIDSTFLEVNGKESLEVLLKSTTLKPISKVEQLQQNLHKIMCDFASTKKRDRM